MVRFTHFAVGLGAVLATAACTPAAPTTAPAPAAPTAVPKPTSVPAVSASPSAASPTVVASPSPAAIAPSAVVVASPSPLPVINASPAIPSASPSVAASANATALRIVSVQPGAPDSTITVENDGGTADDLSGWSLTVGRVSMQLPANTRIEPGSRLVLHTGSGASTGQDVYLGLDPAALASAIQPGAVVALRGASGDVVTQMTMP